MNAANKLGPSGCSFKVRRRQCATCIYRPDVVFDLAKLEDEVRDEHVGFKGYRICHHSHDACCRGFWDRYKDEFAAGQIAQRLKLVVFVGDESDNLGGIGPREDGPASRRT